MRWMSLCFVMCIACGKGHEPPPPSSGSPNARTETGPSVHPPGGNGTDDHALTVYLSTCAPCHGADGHGDGPAAESLNPRPRDYHDTKWQASITDDEIKKTIQLGGAKVGKSAMMPGHPEYDQQTLDGLVKIIRSFGK